MYTVVCPQCGFEENNTSPLYCDECHSPVEKIMLGGEWYDVEDLEVSSPY